MIPRSLFLDHENAFDAAFERGALAFGIYDISSSSTGVVNWLRDCRFGPLLIPTKYLLVVISFHLVVIRWNYHPAVIVVFSLLGSSKERSQSNRILLTGRTNIFDRELQNGGPCELAVQSKGKQCWIVFLKSRETMSKVAVSGVNFPI